MKLWWNLVLAAVLVAALGIMACDGGDGEGNDGQDVVAGEDVDNTQTGDVLEEDPDGTGCTNECGPIGAQQCVDGGNYQVCMADGTCLGWGPSMPCQAGQACNAATGSCQPEGECTNECANVGVRTCTKDGMTVMECQAGGNGCNVLVEAETCGAEETCENGDCVTGQTGDNDCIDIVKCSATCQNQQCVQQCASTASQAGVEAYNAMQQCGATNCAQYQNAPAALQECLVTVCGDSWSGCIGGWGTGTCMGMLQCAQPCGMDADCQLECLISGSAAAQAALWGVQACVEANCADCGQDSNCINQCAQQSCMTEYMACQNS